VKALTKIAEDVNIESKVLNAVQQVNDLQRQRLFAKVYKHFNADLQGKRFALWGLAFKPNTDDMREAPSRDLMEALWEHGAIVQAYDPEAKEEARRIYGERDDLQLCATPEATLQDAEALIIVTEWRMFRSPDFDLIKQRLRQAVIFDGRNLYEPQKMQARGFKYYAIGRGDSLEMPKK
jgi:UDPglucose 6-dehydrogenase